MITNLVGQQVGNYRLTQLLEQEGVETYLGEHIQTGAQTTVKIFDARLSEEDRAEFLHAAHKIARLTHPNIIRVQDSGLHEGRPFLALDYAPQGSLYQRYPQGTRLPIRVVVAYTKQIASALQYAHDQGLIHRDVTPDAILQGKADKLLLGNLGVAAITQAFSSIHSQVSIDALTYMAPEQIQGNAGPASDQYALAVIVYQWLSGEVPFQGSSNEIVAQHLVAQPAPLRNKVPDLSPAVEQVVWKALAKAPNARFSSVQAFADALEQSYGTSQAQGVFSAPAIQPTLPANQSGVAVPAAFSPSPAAASRPTMPFQTPNSGISPLPSSGVTPSVQPLSALPSYPIPIPTGSKPKKKPWLILLVGALIIAVLGGIAAVVIPAMIVYGPHVGLSSGNSGNGTTDSPFHVSATDTSIQKIGLPLQVETSSSDANAPQVTVTSMQMDGRTAFTFSLQRLNGSLVGYTMDPSYFSGPSSNTTAQDQPTQLFKSDDTATSTLVFAATPKAGEQWMLGLTLETPYDPNNPYAKVYLFDYFPLYLQF